MKFPRRDGRTMHRDAPRYALREEVFAVRAARATSTRFAGLWVTGSLAGLARPTVAIVGARAPSDAGRDRAAELGTALAAGGVCVVSGLALGIDGAAHAGALAGGAPTIGVLGGGHRHFFPRRNRALADAMVEAGGAVLSPFPPEEPARPPQFLQRNAIVAALADVVVVVEAAARSGALNTASWAAALGVDVLAYPADVDRPKAAGCNTLIRDGATLVRGPDDVFEALGIARPARQHVHAQTSLALDAPDDDAGAVARALRDRALSIDELVETTHLPPGNVVAALTRLDIGGVIRCHVDGTFVRR